MLRWCIPRKSPITLPLRDTVSTYVVIRMVGRYAYQAVDP